LFFKYISAINSNKNGCHIEEEDEWPHNLKVNSAFEENEKEDLSRLRYHNLKYANEFPAKICRDPLSFIIEVPKF
jgi:hypothetical protein